MRRKMSAAARPAEAVNEFSIAALTAVTEGLRDRLANFRADFIVPVEAPTMPELLNDRERELWLPLFTIAAQATGWAMRCWNAAIQLTVASRQEEPDDSVLLLADIRGAFGGKNKLFSEELLKAIRNLEDPQYSGQATHSAKALANALAPHRIFPKQLRIGRETKKGYLRAWFIDAFAHYLPQSETNETTETAS
jgi:putative DNA primase/helicase